MATTVTLTTNKNLDEDNEDFERDRDDREENGFEENAIDEDNDADDDSNEEVKVKRLLTPAIETLENKDPYILTDGDNSQRIDQGATKFTNMAVRASG